MILNFLLMVLVSCFVFTSNLSAGPATVNPLNAAEEAEAVDRLQQIGGEIDDCNMIGIVKVYDDISSKVEINMKKLDALEKSLRKEFPLVVQRGNVKRAEQILSDIVGINTERRVCLGLLLRANEGLKRAHRYFDKRLKQMERK